MANTRGRQTNQGYKEEQDLVVLQGAAQPHQSHQEQEDANADDPGHHTDAGDQAEPLPPGGHSDQKQTHQLSRKGGKKTKRWKNQHLVRSDLGVKAPGGRAKC